MAGRTSSAIQIRSPIVSLAVRALSKVLYIAFPTWLLLAVRSWLRLRRYNAMVMRIWAKKMTTSPGSNLYPATGGARRLLELGKVDTCESNGDYSVTDVSDKFEPSEDAFALAGDSLQFAAAGRAVLLQVAHPFVAQAMLDHSYLLRDPARATSLRFFRIFGIMYPIWFGTAEDRKKYLVKFHAMHSNIKGVLRGSERIGPFEPGTEYSARDLRAMWWVNATLTESSIAAHTVLGFKRVDEATLEDFWLNWGRANCLRLGVPDDMVPRTWAGFLEDYIAMWHEELGVGEAGNSVVDCLRSSGDSQGAFRAFATRGQLSLSFAWLPAPVRVFYPAQSPLKSILASLTLHLELGLYVLGRMVIPAKLFELTPYVDAKLRKGGQKSVLHSIGAVVALRFVYSVLGVPKGLKPDWS